MYTNYTGSWNYSKFSFSGGSMRDTSWYLRRPKQNEVRHWSKSLHFPYYLSYTRAPNAKTACLVLTLNSCTFPAQTAVGVWLRWGRSDGGPWCMESSLPRSTRWIQPGTLARGEDKSKLKQIHSKNHKNILDFQVSKMARCYLPKMHPLSSEWPKRMQQLPSEREGTSGRGQSQPGSTHPETKRGKKNTKSNARQ